MRAHERFAEMMAELPLVAILRGAAAAELPALAEELLDAGFRMIELPFGRADALEGIARLREAVGEAALVGAGTVTELDQLDALARLDAPLAVSPHFDPALLAHALELELVAIPGVATPSEAWAAARAGAAALKFFPADAQKISSLRVLPSLPPVLAVGGVGQDLEPWVRAGAQGCGIGGALYRPGRDPREVGQRAQALVAAWKRAQEQQT